jgi:hypothetical protein
MQSPKPCLPEPCCVGTVNQPCRQRSASYSSTGKRISASRNASLSERARTERNRSGATRVHPSKRVMIAFASFPFLRADRYVAGMTGLTADTHRDSKVLARARPSQGLPSFRRRTPSTGRRIHCISPTEKDHSQASAGSNACHCRTQNLSRGRSPPRSSATICRHGPQGQTRGDQAVLGKV